MPPTEFFVCSMIKAMLRCETRPGFPDASAACSGHRSRGSGCAGVFLCYLKCPLACNTGAGCSVHGGGEKKKYPANRCLNSWTAPRFLLSFLKGVISTEVFGKTKKVLLLLHEKHWETSALILSQGFLLHIHHHFPEVSYTPVIRQIKRR